MSENPKADLAISQNEEGQWIVSNGIAFGPYEHRQEVTRMQEQLCETLTRIHEIEKMNSVIYSPDFPVKK